MSSIGGFAFGMVLGGAAQWLAMTLSGNMGKWGDAPATNQLLSLIHLVLWGIAGILLANGEK